MVGRRIGSDGKGRLKSIPYKPLVEALLVRADWTVSSASAGTVLALCLGCDAGKCAMT